VRAIYRRGRAYRVCRGPRHGLGRGPSGGRAQHGRDSFPVTCIVPFAVVMRSNPASPLVGRSSPTAFMPLITFPTGYQYPYTHTNSGAGLCGTTTTTRAGAITIPMETCALITVPVAKSVAASSVA
jgi:hypothetical protein